jgi:DUF4097 and DUF4098 domain-containing protein YvlB
MNIDWTTGKSAMLFAALVLTPFAAMAGEDIDRTLDMPEGGLVLVENLAGSVEITTWDRPQVQVRGEPGDSVEEVVIETTSRGVEVRIRNQKDKRRIDGTDLYLRVPQSASIEAEGVSASISVRDSRGESITLSTVSGDVEVQADTERADLKSVSGDVEFKGSTSRMTAEAVSGDVTLVGVDGEVKASTVSGDISVEAGGVSRGRFESVSGETTIALAVGDEGRLTCDSMSGDVEVRLPSSQEGNFSAQSYSGSIRSDFGTVSSVSRGPGSMLDEQVGAGGATIRLETFSGDISIRSE